MLEINVYHGTIRENAQNIEKNKEFIINNDKDNKLYLGAGIYFFEEKIHAVNWDIRLFKKIKNKNPNYEELINGYSIIGASLNVLEKNILNLDNIEDNILLEKLALKVKEKFGVQINNNYVAFINFLQNQKLITDVYVIKKIFLVNIRSKKWGRLRTLARTVYCVKEKSIIGNIEELEITQKEFDSAVYYA